MIADPVTVAAASPTPSLVLLVVKSDGYGSERVDTGGNGYTVITNHTKNKAGSRHYV
jgi:predicted aspartyl protease